MHIINFEDFEQQKIREKSLILKNLVDKLVDKFVYQRMLIYQGFHGSVDKCVYQKLINQYLITSRPPLPPKG